MLDLILYYFSHRISKSIYLLNVVSSLSHSYGAVPLNLQILDIAPPRVRCSTFDPYHVTHTNTIPILPELMFTRYAVGKSPRGNISCVIPI